MGKKNVRTLTFSFSCNREERLLIKTLATQLNRTQSDAVRTAIREKVDEMSQHYRKEYEERHR